ncbi:DUF4158 domain-containing protein [Bradyrhizobium sp. BRP14]|nr:DUF4158 domain-containing protein [Bradyrhizobium sp. BRP14]
MTAPVAPAERHRQEILGFLGVRRMTAEDRNDLATWLKAEICPKAMSTAAMIHEVCLWCRDHGIQTPAIGEVDRFARSARRTFEEAFLQRIASVLSLDGAAKLEASLTESDSPTGFNTMKADPGQVGLESILAVAERLSFIRSFQLPTGPDCRCKRCYRGAIVPSYQPGNGARSSAAPSAAPPRPLRYLSCAPRERNR